MRNAMSSDSFSLTCVSDLHGKFPLLPGGDLLIIAGDICAYGRMKEYEAFNTWCGEQKYDKILVIAGNHDGMMQRDPELFESDACNFQYLCESGVTYRGVNIWGSPYTPEFCDWYFMGKRGAGMKAHWDLIPSNVDILVTHGPPYGLCDKNEDGEACGCEELLHAMETKVAPMLHVFGHIDEESGNQVLYKRWDGNRDTLCVNVSHVDERYRVKTQCLNFLVYC